MKVGLFDPYLDTLGGGEKYILSIAECLSKTHEVLIFWNGPTIKDRTKGRFLINLSKIKFTKDIFSQRVNLFQRFLETRKYDLFIYVSDGSVPFLFAKKNILLFQFPVNWVKGKNILTRLKLTRINKVICYSNFVKVFLDKTFSINSLILPPPVEILNSKPLEKRNIILTVGRFTKGINTKKQEVLIDVFKKMCHKSFSGWKLVMIGSVLPEDENFVVSLRDKAQNYPIEILKNIPFSELVDYYKKAKVYWHAAGFGEDLDKHPEKAEHFGISTVEAMGAGAVPVVFNAGGQKEIVKDGKNGLLWNTPQELEDKTLWVIKDTALWQRLSESAKLTSRAYSKERFCRKLNEILKS